MAATYLQRENECACGNESKKKKFTENKINYQPISSPPLKPI